MTAFAFNLAADEIGAVLLGEDLTLRLALKLSLSGKVLEIPVGEELVGRVDRSSGQSTRWW